MKKLLIVAGIFLLGPLTPAHAYTTVAASNAYMVENTSGTNKCYYVQTTPTCAATFSGLVVSTAAFNGILNQSTLQAGASFYVASGSATLMQAGQYKLNDPGGNWSFTSIGGFFSLTDLFAGNSPIQIQPAGTIFFERQMDGGGHLFNNLGSAYLGSSSINAASILQADSTTQGFLPPRMTTTQKNAISTPPTGLTLYDTTLNAPAFYNGSAWSTIANSAGVILNQNTLQSGATAYPDFLYVGSSATFSGQLSFSSSTVGLVGAVNGNLPGSANIGYTLTSTATAVASGASGVWANITTITNLPPGDWLVYGVFSNNNNTGVITGSSGDAISNFPNNTTTDHVQGSNQTFTTNSGAFAQTGVSISGWHFVNTGTTTLYLKGQATYSSGAPTFDGRLTATRIH